MSFDWTVGKDGRSNTSAAFEDAVRTVSSILRNHHLGDDVAWTSRLIMSQLAHNHGFAPRLKTSATVRTANGRKR